MWFMGILEWVLGSDRIAARADGAGDTETVRRIVAELNRLAPDRARFLAAFAYVMTRVAGADSHICDMETERMVQLVQQVGHLPEDQAVLVTQIAKSQNELFGGTENFLVTREFRDVANDEQRRELVECLFAVSAADHAITGEEEAQIWQIARELGITHKDYIVTRLRYSDHRTVLKPS